MNELWAFLKWYLPSLIDPVVMEIGAANGDDSLFMLEQMKGGKYYAFEPDERTATLFRGKVADKRVLFSQVAVGPFNGTTPFYLSCDRHPYSSSIRKPKLHLERDPSIAFSEVKEVPVITLDSFCEEHQIEKIDFLWVDAQGSEGDIIAGAKNTLPKIQCMVLEYSDLELYEGQALNKHLGMMLGNDYLSLGRFNQGETEGDLLLWRKR